MHTQIHTCIPAVLSVLIFHANLLSQYAQVEQSATKAKGVLEAVLAGDASKEPLVKTEGMNVVGDVSATNGKQVP